jgi:hypothetical protein
VVDGWRYPARSGVITSETVRPPVPESGPGREDVASSEETAMGAPARVPLIPLPSWLSGMGGSRAPMQAQGADSDERRRDALIRKVLKIGGSADEGDRELVRAELAQLPVEVLRAFAQRGGTVVACRGSVMDYKKDLNGFVPGWPAEPPKRGHTWDEVPAGRFDSEVVIAVIGHGMPLGARVPELGEGGAPHGSVFVVAHEVFHLIDGDGAEAFSRSKEFLAAFEADRAMLPDYQQDPRESYAESAAGFYADPDRYGVRTPHLAAYWRANPLGDGRIR